MSKIITIVTTLFLCICVPLAADAAVLLDRVVAVVNKEVITWSELYKIMEYDAADQVRALNEEERMKIYKDGEADFLEKLIDIKLQIQEARRLGLEVTSEEVTEAVESLKKKYSLTDDALRESLKKEGFSFEEYKKRLSEQILISKLVGQQVRNKIVVPEEDIKKFMEKNRESFSDSETFKLRQIFLKRPENDDKKSVEDRASLIIQRLSAGQDFSALAKEYSEDPSGKIGGDIGLIKMSQMTKEFIDALQALKSGDVSRPFWTAKGLHIVKLEERISPQNISEAREYALRQLNENKFSESYKSWIKGLREKAYIIISL